MKTAIITGISGQDGAYLAQFLLKKNYKVIGLLRNSSFINRKNLDYLGVFSDIDLKKCDLLDFESVQEVISRSKPDEVYHLAAQSSVGLSFAKPLETVKFNINSTLNILESIRIIDPSISLYHASSSEMYGGKEVLLPVSESTPIRPLSPYATSKVASHWLALNYREVYQMFVGIGVLFNHESYLRADGFFVKKLIKGAIDIKNGRSVELRLGNLNVRRDMGYSPKYVEAMYKILQHQVPDTFIICSGNSVSLLEIVKHVFKVLDIDLDCLVIDQKLVRPIDLADMYGTNQKAKKILGWEYNLHFFQVLEMLIEEELSASV
jgi:GDPmannose 4,6-dehydratase